MRPGPSKPRYRGTKASVVVGRTKMERSTPEGEFGRVAPASQEAIRKCIESGLCPWCGHGPYRVLALHVHHKHGLDRHEFRKMAGYTRDVSICAPEASERFKELRQQDRRTPPPGKRAQRKACVVCGGQISFTTSRSDKGTCSKECDTRRRSENMAKLRASQPRLARWSKERDSCVSCGTSERPHRTGGQCSPCYERDRTERRRVARQEARRDHD